MKLPSKTDSIPRTDIRVSANLYYSVVTAWKIIRLICRVRISSMDRTAIFDWFRSTLSHWSKRALHRYHVRSDASYARDAFKFRYVNYLIEVELPEQEQDVLITRLKSFNEIRLSHRRWITSWHVTTASWTNKRQLFAGEFIWYRYVQGRHFMLLHSNKRPNRSATTYKLIMSNCTTTASETCFTPIIYADYAIK